LHIIGTERHESRRIDNQLRGRAGRQGDPGSSRFFVSLEDEIMRIFGGDQISKLMDTLNIDENMPIEHPMITRAITQAQIKVEGYFFDQRRNLVNYDDVLNRQRTIIYQRRQNILEQMEESKDDLEDSRWRDRLADTFKTHFELLLSARSEDGFNDTEINNLATELATIIPFDTNSLERIKSQLKKENTSDGILSTFEKVFHDIYGMREKSLGSMALRDIERYVFLSSIDEQWMDHLDNMTNLRDAVWLRGGKEQALAEYKKEAFGLFDTMIKRIELEALKKVFRIHLQPVQPQPIAEDLVMSGPAKTQTTDSTPDLTADPLSKPKKRSAKPRGKRKAKGSYLKK